MFDEFEDDRFWKNSKVVAAVFILGLAAYKVWNEHRMTTMYERQAVALEKIALNGGLTGEVSRATTWEDVEGFARRAGWFPGRKGETALEFLAGKAVARENP